MPRKRIWEVSISLLIAVLVAVAAGTGVFYEAIFKDENPSFATQAVGQDFVTLFLAVPLFLLCTYWAAKGSLRARLAWLGILFYFVYTYLMCAVFTVFNALFLVYVAAYSLALITLIAGAAGLDLNQVKGIFTERTPRRTVGIYSIVMGSALGLVWVKSVIEAMISRETSFLFKQQTSQSLVVQAMDLGLVVPLALIGGVLLLRRRPVGYLLASIMMMKVVTLLTAVWMMAILMWLHNVGGEAQAVVFIGIADLIGLALAAWYFTTAVGKPQSGKLEAR
jgi:hypothetical protein